MNRNKLKSGPQLGHQVDWDHTYSNIHPAFPKFVIYCNKSEEIGNLTDAVIGDENGDCNNIEKTKNSDNSSIESKLFPGDFCEHASVKTEEYSALTLNGDRSHGTVKLNMDKSKLESGSQLGHQEDWDHSYSSFHPAFTKFVINCNESEEKGNFTDATIDDENGNFNNIEKTENGHHFSTESKVFPGDFCEHALVKTEECDAVALNGDRSHFDSCSKQIKAESDNSLPKIEWDEFLKIKQEACDFGKFTSDLDVVKAEGLESPDLNNSDSACSSENFKHQFKYEELVCNNDNDEMRCPQGGEFSSFDALKHTECIQTFAQCLPGCNEKTSDLLPHVGSKNRRRKLCQNINNRYRAVNRNKKEKVFQCYYCNCTFPRKPALETHILSKHLKEKPYVCQHCDYAAVKQSALTLHVLYRHTKEKRFKCGLCEYGTAEKRQLKRHLMSRYGSSEKPFKCDMCYFSAVKKSNLTVHISFMHTKCKPFKCEICSYSTAVKYNLKSHIIRMHTTEKPYKCSICGFATTSNLRRHMRTHTKKTFRKHK